MASPARFPCPGCSADLEFDPASGSMKCPYCGTAAAVPGASLPEQQPAPPREFQHPLREYLGDAARDKLQAPAAGALELTCSGCGSRVVFTPPQVAGQCAFCGAKIVAQPKAADPLIAPDGVLPAAIPQRDALHRVKQWLGSRWFAPSDLQNLARQDAIQGVYLPYWMYASGTQTQYTGQRGEYYYVEETYRVRNAQGAWSTETRRVRKTRWYPAQGEVARQFENLLVAATRSVAPEKLRALDPWNLDRLQNYEPAFLSGFQAQRYQVPLDQGYEEAKQTMAAIIEADIRRDIGGDEQQVHSRQTGYFDEAFRHLLLPVWIGAYRFQGKVYQVVVNGCTGEVQGERPYSAGKIALFIAAILLLLFVISVLSRQ